METEDFLIIAKTVFAESTFTDGLTTFLVLFDRFKWSWRTVRLRRTKFTSQQLIYSQFHEIRTIRGQFHI